MRIVCLPDDFDACSDQHPLGGHYCNQQRGRNHPETHACTCGHVWARDVSFERACVAYLAYHTIRYIDAPEYPSARVVHAACRPTDSPWRHVGQALHDYIEGQQ